MNQQLSQLLEKLATKLGTTTEYLWGVLLKQARISATITLIYFLLCIVVGFVFYKLHISFSRTDSKNPHSNNAYYEHEELGIIMSIAVGVWGICFILVTMSLSNIFNGYLNPEYWALNKILDSI